MAKDLTGVKQKDLLRERGSPWADDAKLTALHIARSDPKLGKIWTTQCECGNERDVPAMYFTSGRIRKCGTCVSPDYVKMIPKLVERRMAIRNQFYSDEFKRNWRRHLEAFNEDQMLLFETIMHTRRRCPALMLQAVDLVIRAGDKRGIELELDSFPDERVELARRRLQDGT